MTKKSETQIRILGIETSCDDTGVSIVEKGGKILSSVLFSQADLHAEYGGVFPEMASRSHVETIGPAIKKALQEAHIGVEELDAVAVTRGPGLAGSLVVGVNAAKGLALAANLPILGVNHIEAHIYSSWLEDAPKQEFPLLCLIVSGGHTELILMQGHGSYQRMGQTLDDAAGEAFDKVARMIGLAYPGGPSIQLAAEKGDPHAFRFPRAWLDDTWDFSFSGLKTAVLREVKKRQPGLRAGVDVPEQGLPVADLAASFQSAVVEVLAKKACLAAESCNAKGILLAGGVAANNMLRENLQKQASIPVYVPKTEYCTDNAAMVAAAGMIRFEAGQRDSLDFDVLPNWELGESLSEGISVHERY